MKYFFILIAFLSMSAKGFSNIRGTTIQVIPYRTLDQIDPARNRQYVLICGDSECSKVFSKNPNQNPEYFEQSHLFVSDPSMIEKINALGMNIPDEVTVVRVDQLTLDYMKGKALALVSTTESPENIFGVSDELYKEGKTCALLATVCTISVVNIEYTWLFWVGIVAACSEADNRCDEVKEKYKKEKAEKDAKEEAQKKLKNTGVATNDPMGKNNFPAQGAPGPLSQSPIYIPGYGTIKCGGTPKTLCSDNPPPKHQM